MFHVFFNHVVVVMMMFAHGLMVTRGHVVVHFAFLHALLHIFRASD